MPFSSFCVLQLAVADLAACANLAHEVLMTVHYATLTAKVGKEVVTNKMAVGGGLIEATLPAGGTVTVTNGFLEADLFDAWQYNWKSEPWKTLIKPLDKQTSTYYIDETGAMIDEYETARR